MAYLTDDEIKRELAEMLRVLNEFLCRNGIDYSVAYGTMLGCVRHEGFIPWDDDVDIAILRPEYRKLLKLLQKDPNIGKDLFACGAELKNGEWPFIKIFNRKIKAQEQGMKNADYLWIDIFPFDGLPKRPARYLKHVKTLKNIYCYRRSTVDTKMHGRKYKMIKGIVCGATCWIGNESYLSHYIKQCKKYGIDKSDFVQDVVWGKTAVPTKLFYETADYQFENITVKGFRDYDTYLTLLYGDYWTLPPKEQRISHGIKAWRTADDET